MGKGNWFDDIKIADIVGEDWLETVFETDEKEVLVAGAQKWFNDGGFDVKVLDCEVCEEFINWKIEGFDLA